MILAPLRPWALRRVNLSSHAPVLTLMAKIRDKLKRRRKRNAKRGEGARSSDPSLARTLAPEEVRVGDFVAVLHEIVEFPSWYWDLGALPPHEPVRVAKTPEHGGVPLAVEAVCLPFVLVKSPCGAHRTLDVRANRLARVDADFAAAVKRVVRQARAKATRAARTSPSA